MSAVFTDQFTWTFLFVVLLALAFLVFAYRHQGPWQ